MGGGGGANLNFPPQQGADLHIFGELHLAKNHLLGELNCLSLYITINLTFLLGELMGELIIDIGGAIAPPSDPLEPPMRTCIQSVSDVVRKLEDLTKEKFSVDQTKIDLEAKLRNAKYAGFQAFLNLELEH